MIVCRPNILPPRPGALERALRAARQTLRGASPDLILVNDPQRATASADVLERARRMGWNLESARLLVATGSHRFVAADRQDFERRFAAFAPRAWHDARATDLVEVGGTSGWRAHPWLAEARRVLAIGSVEPHYFAGFSGAHKTLTIGCAAYADIETNHAGALSAACRPGVLAGTPVHAGIAAMLKTLARARTLAAVNLVQVGDVVMDAAGGAPLEALEALVPRVEAMYVRRLPAPVKALVAEVTGALGCSFYQADKGIKNNEWAVRDGGVLVLAAACPQGVGQSAFVDVLRMAPTHAAALAEVARRGYRLGDHKAVRLRQLTDPSGRNVRLYVVSHGLSEADAAVLGVRKAPTVEAALAEAGVGAGRGAVKVEDAGNTCVLADRAAQIARDPGPSAALSRAARTRVQILPGRTP